MKKAQKIIYNPVFVIVVICLSFGCIICLFQFYDYRTSQLIAEKDKALWLLNGWELLQNTTKDLLITEDLPAAQRRWTEAIDAFDGKIHSFINSDITRQIYSDNKQFRHKIKETENLWRVIKPRMEYARDQFNNYLAIDGTHSRNKTLSLLNELFINGERPGHKMNQMVLFDLTYDIQYLVSSLNNYFVSVLSDTVKHIIDLIDQESREIRYIAIISTLIIMCLTTMFILVSQRRLAESNVQLKFLSNQLIQAEVKEHRRIAYELHDQLGQSLTAIKYASEQSMLLAKKGDSAACCSVLDNVVRNAQQAIAETRRLSKGLHPAIIDQLGITATITWFTREFNELYKHISITKSITVDENDVPGNLKIIIYRTLQESLNNIAKHSKASSVDVQLFRGKNKISFNIKDNGIGFPIENIWHMRSKIDGLGLLTMRERIELSGGMFSVQSSKSGTSISAQWAI